MDDPIYVLGDDIGYVELLDWMGDDLSVVNAARVSFANRSEIYDLRDGKLIRYLMRNHHGTPFEHVVFQFRARAPLFVVHQWERHRMASYNEESGRYIELRADFYVPEDSDYADRYARSAIRQYKEYQELLALGEPKERARMVLTCQLYKEFWFTINARSLMNFLALRNDDHAQWEIRQYAIAMEHLFERIAPDTLKAFREFERTAP